MATETEIIEALRPVQDPELHRSIVDLGMVKNITIDGKAVSVTVALTIAGCPLRAELTDRVTNALKDFDDIDSVNVEMTVMTDEERQAVSESLQSGGASHGDHTHAAENPFTSNRTRILAVASGKGGVGKSSVSTNVAIALAQLGYKVAAVDADVWGFSMPRMLGIDRSPTVIDNVILPPDAHGVSLISMGFFARDDQPVVWRGPMLHKALEQFLADVHWDDPDYLVIDMPPGTGDVSISIAQFLPRAEVIVVTTPQPAAQKVAQRAAYMAQQVNLSVIGVVENMSWFTADDGKRYEIFGSGGGAVLAEDLDVPLLGQIPLVPELRAGGDAGHPIVIDQPDSEAAQTFASIAKQVADLAPTKIYHPELKIS